MARDDEDVAPETGGDREFDTRGALDVLDPGVLHVAREALTRVGEALGTPTTEHLTDEDDLLAPLDRATVSRHLRRGWDDVAAAVRALAETGDQEKRSTPLIDVLSIVRTAEDLVGSSSALRGSAVSRVRERIHSLDTAGSLDRMVDRAPVIAAGLGFDRVLLSRVVDSTWIPERLYFKGNAEWAGQVLEAMSKNPLSLNTSVLETQMVRQAVPLRVVDPASRPLMNRVMVRLSRTPGYIAAPITEAGRVVGFLHADCYYQGRVPSQSDVETLWMFTQAMGPVLARQGLTERLAELRREIDAPVPVLGLGRPRVSVKEREATARAAHPRSTEPSRHGPSPRTLVTRREVEVLRLMSEGASNEQIARRLVISVGTVKSHVKRILRKLDVTNRAEAASLWLRSEYGQMPADPSDSTNEA
jgi:DNA-binding CsgD family transcriptional regulator